MPSQAPVPRSRRADRQAQILAAARRLLETRGLVGSSVADVAALAEVSEATVFSYFRTRRDLMVRVITDWMEPVIERLEADLPHIRGAEARLMFLAGRHLREMEGAPGLHQLIYRELHWEDYYGSELHRLNQRYTKLVGWIVAEGKAAGEVRDTVDADVTRDMLFGAFQHIGWRTSLNRRPLDIETTTAQIVGQIFAGISLAASGTEPSKLDRIVDRLEAVADRLGGAG